MYHDPVFQLTDNMEKSFYFIEKEETKSIGAKESAVFTKLVRDNAKTGYTYLTTKICTNHDYILTGQNGGTNSYVTAYNLHSGSQDVTITARHIYIASKMLF